MEYVILFQAIEGSSYPLDLSLETEKFTGNSMVVEMVPLKGGR